MATHSGQTRRAVTTAAAAVAMLIGSQAYAGQHFSFEEPLVPADPNWNPPLPERPVGAIKTTPGAPSGDYANYLWGDSWETGAVTHAQSSLYATNGPHSMRTYDADGGFASASQVGYYNPNGTYGTDPDPFDNGRTADLIAGTKLLFDVTVPEAGPEGPDWSGVWMIFNYAAGILGSYNPVDAGNYYQLAFNPSMQTGPRTQTYTWDFGGQFIYAAGQYWPGLTHYVLMHVSENSGVISPRTDTPAREFYFDNLRIVSEKGTMWKGTGAAPSWTDAASWTGAVPNAIGARAVFYTGGGTSNVMVNSGITVGSIVFDAAVTSYGSVSVASPPPIVNYTLSGTGSITFDVGTGTEELRHGAEIYIIAGNHFINVPVVANDNLSVDTSAGFGPDSGAPINSGQGRVSSVPVTSLDFGSTVALAANTTLTTRGVGTVTFGAIRGNGALVVNGGVSRISAKTTPNSSTGTSVVTSLSIAPAAKLDLTNNALIIDYTGPVGTLVSDVRQHLQAGRITNSVGDGSKRHGYADNAVLGRTTFAGQTVDATSLLLKYTWAGDTNLDGQVDITDLGALATSWQTAGTWINGDLDYSGFIDITDLGMLATNWQMGVGNPIPGGPSLGEALASLGLPGVSVPEPGSVGLMGLGLMGVVLRRRRV